VIDKREARHYVRSNDINCSSSSSSPFISKEPGRFVAFYELIFQRSRESAGGKCVVKHEINFLSEAAAMSSLRQHAR
jgi:hypothetical protein